MEREAGYEDMTFRLVRVEQGGNGKAVSGGRAPVLPGEREVTYTPRAVFATGGVEWWGRSLAPIVAR